MWIIKILFNYNLFVNFNLINIIYLKKYGILNFLYKKLSLKFGIFGINN